MLDGGITSLLQNPQTGHGGQIVLGGDEVTSAAKGRMCGSPGIFVGLLHCQNGTVYGASGFCRGPNAELGLDRVLMFVATRCQLLVAVSTGLLLPSPNMMGGVQQNPQRSQSPKGSGREPARYRLPSR